MPIFFKQPSLVTKTKTPVRFVLMTWTITLFTVASVIFMAITPNNQKQTSTNQPEIIYNTLSEVELDMPDYIPEQLRHPQKFLASKKIRIKKDILDKAIIQYAKGAQQIEIQLQPIDAQESEKNYFVFQLPNDMTSDGKLQLYFKAVNGQTPTIKNLKIEKLPAVSLATPSEDISARSATAEAAAEKKLFLSRIQLNCDGCGYELVLAGQPNDSNNLLLQGFDRLIKTIDGWTSWSDENINEITEKNSDYKRRDTADGDLSIQKNGNFALPGVILLRPWTESENALLGGGIHFGNFDNKTLTEKIIKNATGLILKPDDRLIFDYPRIARYNNKIYISANHVKFTDNNFYANGIFVSKDDGITFNEYRSNAQTSITSMDTALDGQLYAVEFSQGLEIKPEWHVSVLRWDKKNNQFDKKIIYKTNNQFYGYMPKVSLSNNTAWMAYQGPVILIDKTNSKFKNRIYITYAAAKKIVADLNSEYPAYTYNNDIFLTYSDDQGATWSNPIKVNDDIGSGDQVYPSMSIDQNGVLHITFLDHRNNQNRDEVDAYYTYSIDGGKTFAKNIKVNEQPISIHYGGRTLGDYLYMLVAYQNKIYIAYPCQAINSLDPYPIASNACITILKNPANIEKPK